MESVQTVKRKQVLLIGPSGDWKTTLIMRLKGKYSFPLSLITIGIDSERINLSFNNGQYSVELWDTPGAPAFYSSVPKKIIKHSDLILLLFTEQRMKDAIELFYPFYIENREESNKLIFVENYVKKENNCILTERQKQEFLDKVKKFDEDYIQIDCNTIYNIDTLKELIGSHLYDYKNYLVRRKRKEIIGNFSIILRTQKNKEINTRCV